MIIKGKIFKFGDNIDTDQIYPGIYLDLINEDAIAEKAMSGIRNNFYKEVDDSDVIIAGKNFGCGSSREHAVIALKGAGIKVIIAESFGRIFYRNSINLGLLLIEKKVDLVEIKEKEKININLNKNLITLNNKSFKIYDNQVIELFKKGGIKRIIKKNPNKYSDVLDKVFN